MKPPDLRQYGGLWTILWRDSTGRTRQKRLGRVDAVSEDAAASAASGFLAELAEYGDPIELPRKTWPVGARWRVGWKKACVFCGAETHKRLHGHAVCHQCGDYDRKFELLMCGACGQLFPIIRDDTNAMAVISRCWDCDMVEA